MTAPPAAVESWTAPDGARLALRRAVPPGEPRAALLLLHGFGDHSGRYGHVIDWALARGLAVYALDQRGHGRSPGPRGHITRFAQFLADVAALRKRAAAEVAAPQVLLGHSFGGLVVLRYLETSPPPLAAAVVTSPWIGLAMRAPRWKLAVARVLGDVAPAVGLATGLDTAALSSDPAVGHAARSDPLYHTRMTAGAWREIRAAQAAVRAESARITCPVLFLVAGEDRIISRADAEELARAVPGAECLVYEGLFHELFNERERARVLADLGAWLDRALAGPGTTPAPAAGPP